MSPNDDHPYQVPVIRLEIQRLKQTLMVALSDHATQMDADLQAALDRYLTPENVARIIDEEAHRQLDALIKEEVANWFRYGGGRQAIKEAIEAKLDNRRTYTPLDEEEEEEENHAPAAD